MPEVQVGLVRFEDSYDVMSPLTSNVDELRHRVHMMEPMVGETKMTPPLQHAMRMLDAAPAERPVCAPSVQSMSRLFPVSKAVIVVTDGDPPSDLVEATKQVQEMAASGVNLVFVKIQKHHCERGDEYLGRLCSPCLHGTDSASSGGHRTPRNSPPALFTVRDEMQALESLVPHVFQRMLSVTQRISRASCAVPPTPYIEEIEPVPDVGLDIRLPDSEVILDQDTVPWNPSMGQELEPPSCNARSAIVRMRLAIDQTLVETHESREICTSRLDDTMRD